MAFFHGFETKDWTDWETFNSGPTYSVETSIFFSGSASGRVYTGDVRQEGPYQRLNFSEDFDTVEFYWREQSNSMFGFHMTAENGSGNRIFGVGSDNPQWDYESAGGVSNLYSGDGVERWIRTKVVVNGDGTFTAEFEDNQSGTFRDVTANVINSGPVRSLTLESQPKFDGEGQFMTLWLDEINVSSSNSPPSASLSVTNSDEDLDVFADASGSSDPDGDSLTFDYDWGDGTNSNNAGDTATHTYSNAGQFNVTVTVTDSSGASDQASDSVFAILNNLEANDGGTIKTPNALKANDGGTIKDVKRVFVNDGGTIKKVYDDPRV